MRNGSRKRLKDCRLQLVLKSQFQAQSRYEQANDRKLVENVLDSHPMGRVQGRSELVGLIGDNKAINAIP